MAKVTFEVEIEAEEVREMTAEIRELIKDFGFPVYSLHASYGNGTTHTIAGGSERGTVLLPPVDLGMDARDLLRALCGTEVPEDDDDCEDEQPPAVGDIVEVGGIEYVVFAANMAGELELHPRDELVEDHFLG